MESFAYSKEQLKEIPDHTGIYKYYNQEGDLIYVGKAKSLRKRISSYFTNSYQDRKTARLIKEISSIEVAVVDSEFDALLLENNLIKEFQPKYNILLKDDKTFPYLLVTNERFPRIFPTRQKVKGKGTYFGPYASVKAMKNILQFIKGLYNIRTCNYNLSRENVDKGKFKVCLEYHIGNCLGPCENLQSEEDYQADIDQAIHILKGNLSTVKQYFKEQMRAAAEDMAYEKAQYFKERLQLVEKFQSKSLVVNQKLTNIDVCTFLQEEKRYFINYLKVDEGSIVISETRSIKHRQFTETPEELFQQVLYQFREKFHSDNQQVLTNLELPMEHIFGEQLEVIKPKIGDKKKLVELSLKNAYFFKKEQLKKSTTKLTWEERVLSQLKNDLRLTTLPYHIECFDNSNLMGNQPVASMVCFKAGKPAKKDYRHYNIKTVQGPDDFASMKEVVGRRYRRLIDEEQKLPDLVVIDGGKGQLGAAQQALEDLGLYGQLAIIGIAKRLEEIYVPDDPFPLHISKKSESLKLLQFIRDEAHRFAITFHRQKRERKLTSSLALIEGIGPKTETLLLKKFKSVKAISQASLEDLSDTIGKKKALQVYDTIHHKKTSGNT